MTQSPLFPKRDATWDSQNSPLTPESAYRRMVFVRKFEDKSLELSKEGLVAGSIHLCFGQEAIPVGAMSVLEPRDRVLATYRGHGWVLASGSAPEAALGEVAQRAGGLNGGRAGSPIMSDPANGFLGENSIVGAGSPIATGVALALQRSDDNGVVITSFGDGAMNQGATMEGMVFAAARKLPVIFACENNGWAEMTPTEATLHGDAVDRARGIGIESHKVDGGDPFAVAEAVARAAEACRRGEGPIFLEFKTVRLSGHYNRDIQHYRPKADIELAQSADPLVRLRSQALAESGLSAEYFDQIDAEVEAEVERIAANVLAMPSPDTSTVGDHLYADALEPTPGGWGEQTESEMTYQRAANLALREELSQRPEMLVYGEDIATPGGVFGVTRGLQKEFGEDRVFDTPISESAILGSAVGASMLGMRPVVEIMWADFVFVAFDQIINQASNVRYINRSQLSAPLTIRMQQGVTDGSCAQHSQSVESFMAHIPGVKVGLVSNAQDAYRMTRAAIADPDPTILIESRALYQDSETIVTGGDPETVGGARRHRTGGDIAIITWGAMVKKSLQAADLLEAEGISATVLDLRWLRPLDDEAIAAAVIDAGGRVLVVHEDYLSGGFGAEVAARITENHFDLLESSVKRMGAAEVRIPSAPVLQKSVIPTAEDIAAAASEAVALANQQNS